MVLSKFEVPQVFCSSQSMASLMSLYWLEILHLSTYTKERIFCISLSINKWQKFRASCTFYWLGCMSTNKCVFNLLIFCITDWWVKALQVKIWVQFSPFKDSSYLPFTKKKKKISNDSTVSWNILFCWNRMEQYWFRALQGCRLHFASSTLPNEI